eukprot:904008-Rhodomonas_salina.1
MARLVTIIGRPNQSQSDAGALQSIENMVTIQFDFHVPLEKALGVPVFRYEFLQQVPRHPGTRVPGYPGRNSYRLRPVGRHSKS